MTQTIVTSVEQAAEIVKAALDPQDDRYYWMIVADVLKIDREAAFSWSAVGSSSQPDQYNRLVVRVDADKKGFRA